MFKSVFAKYFSIYAGLLLAATLALGIVQLMFFNNYWIADRRAQLTENVEKIASHAADVTSHYAGNPNSYVISGRRVQPTVDLLSESLGADILIVDTAGRILLSSRDVAVTKPVVPQTALAQMKDEYFSVSNVSGLFNEVHYTAAEPIVMPDGTCIGYTLMAIPADGLVDYMQDTLKTYLMSALLVLLVSSGFVYLLTYRMAKPLREMAVATRRFAEGDFSVRVKVNGKDELAELAAALNSMAVSLAATENMSRSFVANVSHELKTPMTTISGFVDGVLDGTIPKDRQAHYLRIVSDETKRLSRLVKSMLELSRIDNGTVSLKPKTFDLTDTVCSTLLSFETRIEEKNVSISGLSDCPRTSVTADYDLVTQVVYNLLDNAVKFVDDGGDIAIDLQQADGRVYCAVRNTGTGIAAEEMPRVFERFYKTDRSRSLDKTGVGLGLYIVKTVINLHGGEIYVRSVQGEYCEFVFWLPQTSPHADAPGKKPALSD